MRHPSREPHRERGAAMIVVSITAIMSLFFVALGVDIALLYNLRRQGQGAADLAALGGAQDLYDDSVVTAVVADVLSNSELDGLTAADLNRCTTETIPTEFTKLPSANCISVNALRTQVRVRLPDQDVSTAFAQVFGVDQLRYTAVALAGVETEGNGGVLPFWIPLSGSGYSCLKSGSSSVPDPNCSSSSSGNFGYANFGIWGNPDLGTTTNCTGSGSNRMPQNTAMGIDHDLSMYNAAPHATTTVVDHDSCGSVLRPNAADTLTGNMNNQAGAAFFSGGPFADGKGSRLTRTDQLSWSNETNVSNWMLDDNPLWEFIGPSTTNDVPNSCRKNQFVSGGVVGNLASVAPAVATYLTPLTVPNRMIKLLDRCMTHYEGNAWNDDGAMSPAEPSTGCSGPCSDPVFDRDDADDAENDLFDLQYSPRFGYVPRIHTDTPSGNQVIRFVDFEPIFLQRLYGGNCGGSSCSIEFDPGVGYSGGNGSKANALTAFVIPSGMLPGGLGADDAPFAIGVNKFVSVIG